MYIIWITSLTIVSTNYGLTNMLKSAMGKAYPLYQNCFA